LCTAGRGQVVASQICAMVSGLRSSSTILVSVLAAAAEAAPDAAFTCKDVTVIDRVSLQQLSRA
jgi:hypothetical protein